MSSEFGTTAETPSAAARNLPHKSSAWKDIPSSSQTCSIRDPLLAYCASLLPAWYRRRSREVINDSQIGRFSRQTGHHQWIARQYRNQEFSQVGYLTRLGFEHGGCFHSLLSASTGLLLAALMASRLTVATAVRSVIAVPIMNSHGFMSIRYAKFCNHLLIVK